MLIPPTESIKIYVKNRPHLEEFNRRDRYEPGDLRKTEYPYGASIPVHLYPTMDLYRKIDKYEVIPYGNPDSWAMAARTLVSQSVTELNELFLKLPSQGNYYLKSSRIKWQLLELLETGRIPDCPESRKYIDFKCSEALFSHMDTRLKIQQELAPCRA